MPTKALLQLIAPTHSKRVDQGKCKTRQDKQVTNPERENVAKHDKSRKTLKGNYSRKLRWQAVVLKARTRNLV